MRVMIEIDGVLPSPEHWERVKEIVEKCVRRGHDAGLYIHADEYGRSFLRGRDQLSPVGIINKERTKRCDQK